MSQRGRQVIRAALGYHRAWRREGAAGSAGRTESTSEAPSTITVASSSA